MLEGLGARCVQHEMDHLNGIIFLQRASRLKIERALKARKKERKKRLDYEQRVALAKHFQSLQAKDAEKSNDTGEVSGDNSVSQDTETSNWRRRRFRLHWYSFYAYTICLVENVYR